MVGPGECLRLEATMKATHEVIRAGDERLVARPGDVDALVGFIANATVDEDPGATPDQVVTRHRFLELALRGAPTLDRTSSPSHFTASALVVEAGAERVAVLWHNKAQRWLQPGGHADGDGNLAHVAWKEATEETGILGLAVAVPAVHLDIHPFTPPGEEAHVHFDLRFVVLAPPGSTPSSNHESAEVRWVEPGELDRLDPDPGLVHLTRWGLAVARSVPTNLWP